MACNDILRKLVNNSRLAIDDGVYDVGAYDLPKSDVDLACDIRAFGHAPVISEIKFSSPSEGKLRTASDPAVIASKMIRGGARGLSVLTQPHLFGGSPEYFAKVRQSTDVPMLMKDIIVDKKQMDAAAYIGADYILLIWSVFESGLLETHPQTSDKPADAAQKPHHNSNMKRLDEFTRYAHQKGLGVLLEVHTPQEYAGALDTDCDIIGINNRNLDTLEVDIDTTKKILDAHHKDRKINGSGRYRREDRRGSKVTISESGISSADDIRYLYACGAEGFLVGSSIMKNDNVEKTVRDMVAAY